MKPTTLCFVIAVGLTAIASAAGAQITTQIRVRVVSHDAKIIGSGVGGAAVVVRDPATGHVLATGIQEGSTGNTEAIVTQPVTRGAAIYDTPGAAVFTVSVILQEPTVLEFVAEGPLGYEHAVQRASKTMLVVPGEDVLGDGVVLELHGFIVELLAPTAPVGTDATEVRARVRMMCGCPLEPGGLWDADRVEVSARISAGGRVVREVPLAYAGEPSMFGARLDLTDLSEGATVIVVAADRARVNFGRSEAVVLK